MISLEKWIILAPLRKLPNNVGNLGQTIVATGFELLLKVEKIGQSGHTECYAVVKPTVFAKCPCIRFPSPECRVVGPKLSSNHFFPWLSNQKV